MNKLWKKYGKLTDECYTQFVMGSLDMSCWTEAFEALVKAIEAERVNNKAFGKELFELEDELDYRCDIQGWLEDYLDELDMRGQHDELIECCRKVIQMFEWKEDRPSEYNFRIVSALRQQKKTKEAHEFCEAWYGEDQDNLVAATAVVYDRISIGDIQGAEAVVKRFIQDDTVCAEDNDIMFIAAEALYKAAGNKKAEKKIKKAIQEYEDMWEKLFTGEEDDDWDDEDLPFM